MSTKRSTKRSGTARKAARPPTAYETPSQVAARLDRDWKTLAREPVTQPFFIAVDSPLWRPQPPIAKHLQKETDTTTYDLSVSRMSLYLVLG